MTSRMALLGKVAQGEVRVADIEEVFLWVFDPRLLDDPFENEGGVEVACDHGFFFLKAFQLWLERCWCSFEKRNPNSSFNWRPVGRTGDLDQRRAAF